MLVLDGGEGRDYVASTGIGIGIPISTVFSIRNRIRVGGYAQARANDISTYTFLWG